MPFSSDSYGLASAVNGSRIVGACVLEGLAVWSGEDGASPTIVHESLNGFPQVSLTVDGRFAFVGTTGGVVAQWDLNFVNASPDSKGTVREFAPSG